MDRDTLLYLECILGTLFALVIVLIEFPEVICVKMLLLLLLAYIIGTWITDTLLKNPERMEASTMKPSTIATVASAVAVIGTAILTISVFALLTGFVHPDPNSPSTLTFIAVMTALALGSLVCACIAIEYDREAERLEGRDSY